MAADVEGHLLPTCTRAPAASSRRWLPRLDPFTDAFQADPHRVYAQYRERCPIHWGRAANPGIPGAWYLFGRADVASVLKDPRFGREGYGGHAAERPFFKMVRNWILFRDAPFHARIRRHVTSAFTPAAVARMEPAVTRSVEELLDRAARAGGMEVIDDFALPLAIAVICDLIGVPPADRPRIREWAIVLARALDFKRSSTIYDEADQAASEIDGYLRRLATRSPGTGGLLDRLLANTTTVTIDEILATCALLLVTGHATTHAMIGNGVLCLLEHAEQLACLRRDPRLAPDAVDEILRYASPVQMAGRWATDDLELGGLHIVRGDAVICVLGAANRDPAVCPDPDRFDLGRGRFEHLSFGSGTHVCLGVALARLQGRIAFARLAERFPRMRLVSGVPTWKTSVLFRSLASLTIEA